MVRSRSPRLFGLFSILFGLVTGCALPNQYQLGSRDQYYRSKGFANAPEEQIVRGQPRPIIDKIGWVVGIPSKIILWNRKVDNHNISEETEVAVAQYLAANELDDVKVRLNQYAPLDEWRRLTKNDAVGAGWRYTFGVVSVAKEAVLPGRIFGGSNYNPYTNSIYIYDDVPALALHEAGHAKDWAQRKYKGTYAAIYAVVPGAPLYSEAIATRDVLTYTREFGDFEEERNAYKMLYPAYGTYVGGVLGDAFIGSSGVLYGVGVVGGHIAGRWHADHVPDFNRRSAPLGAGHASTNQPGTPLLSTDDQDQVALPSVVPVSFVAE